MAGEADVASGALQGAMSGAAFGAPGIIVGALLGGIFGKKKAKARKAQKQAQATQRQLDDIQNAAMRRQQVREYMIARAESVAAAGGEVGGLESSPTLGAIGSLGSQFAYNTRYFDTTLTFQAQYQNYINRAAKYSRQAELGMTALKLAGGLKSSYDMRSGRKQSIYDLQEYTPVSQVKSLGGSEPPAQMMGTLGAPGLSGKF